MRRWRAGPAQQPETGTARPTCGARPHGRKALRKAWQRLQLGCGRGPLLLHHDRHPRSPRSASSIAGCIRSANGSLPKRSLKARPARHGARHGDGIEAAFGRSERPGAVFAVEVTGRPGLGCRAAGVEPVQLLTIPEDAERIRAQAVAHRLGDRQCRGGGDGRVHRVAALQQHAQAGLRCQRVRGAHDIARKQRQPGAGDRGWACGRFMGCILIQ